jgi:NAD(P)-dependent dehydrogenase (short-subunit alcohol dehydrogenase family)
MDADMSTQGNFSSTGRLTGKVIAITGGCGDIGKSTGFRLCQEGAQVILLDLFSADTAAADLDTKATSGNITYLHANVTDRSSMESAFQTILQRHDRLDAAIANAGIVLNQPFLEVTYENWMATLDVNLTGAFHTAQIAARIMAKQKPTENGVRGKILFTGSWVQDMPWPEGSSYIVSKGGVKMMAKVIAQELASLGIRVNLLAPGIVMGGLSKKIYESDPAYRERVGTAIPLGDMQSVDSVADAYVFLCSKESDYMTGATLLVDGGASLVRRA